MQFQRKKCNTASFFSPNKNSYAQNSACAQQQEFLTQIINLNFRE